MECACHFARTRTRTCPDGKRIWSRGSDSCHRGLGFAEDGTWNVPATLLALVLVLVLVLDLELDLELELELELVLDLDLDLDLLRQARAGEYSAILSQLRASVSSSTA